jgi:hypothetical protein
MLNLPGKKIEVMNIITGKNIIPGSSDEHVLKPSAQQEILLMLVYPSS